MILLQEKEVGHEKKDLTPDLVWLLAAGCGVTVANLYYSQPLLAQMSKSWHCSEAQMGSIAALTMCGYGSGLLLFVPLGDIFERRGLILSFLVAVVIVLSCLAAAPNLVLLGILTYLLGCLTIIPQLIIPLATGLSTREQRGAIVGNLMSGLLLGILVSRSLGGLIGDHFGWRAVYAAAAGINIILFAWLFLRLPKSYPTSKLRYIELLSSIWQIACSQQKVRTSAFFGAMTFAAFNAFWTTLSFLTSIPPFNLNPEQIGLFGLIGASGVLAAPVAGRMADTRGPMLGIGLSLAIMLSSWAILGIFGLNMIGLIAGIVVLDLAAHSSQVSNMARIYSLKPEMYSRVNTIYMVSYFIGGSLGAWAGTQAWTRMGWTGVCLTGAAFAIIGLLLYAVVLGSQREQFRS